MWTEPHLSFYAFHRIQVRTVLTDNGVTYRSNAFADACRALWIKYKFTKPYRPQTNVRPSASSKRSPASGPTASFVVAKR